ncbi:hypothetical protein NKH77_42040 [Streptomyces sp. M19]
MTTVLCAAVLDAAAKGRHVGPRDLLELSARDGRPIAEALLERLLPDRRQRDRLTLLSLARDSAAAEALAEHLRLQGPDQLPANSATDYLEEQRWQRSTPPDEPLVADPAAHAPDRPARRAAPVSGDSRGWQEIHHFLRAHHAQRGERGRRTRCGTRSRPGTPRRWSPRWPRSSSRSATNRPPRTGWRVCGTRPPRPYRRRRPPGSGPTSGRGSRSARTTAGTWTSTRPSAASTACCTPCGTCPSRTPSRTPTCARRSARSWRTSRRATRPGTPSWARPPAAGPRRPGEAPFPSPVSEEACWSVDCSVVIPVSGGRSSGRPCWSSVCWSRWRPWWRSAPRAARPVRRAPQGRRRGLRGRHRGRLRRGTGRQEPHRGGGRGERAGAARLGVPVERTPIPYVRIALMMPFTADEHSAMTTAMIRRALAGSLAAQRQANRLGGPHYQLLLAPDGRNLDQWRPVVARLAELAADTRTPLVGVTGVPSSTSETRESVAALSGRRIPTVGPVITAATMNAPYFFKASPATTSSPAPSSSTWTASRGSTGVPGAGQPQRGRLLAEPAQRLREALRRGVRPVRPQLELHRHLRHRPGHPAAVHRRRAEDLQRQVRHRLLRRARPGPARVRRAAGAGGSCGRTARLRILKVGIGLEPTLTTDASGRWLDEARATIVDASSVDPAWWSGKSEPGKALGRFLDRFEEVRKQHELGAKPLDDGYAIMYHDAFTLLAGAVDRTYAEINEGGKQTPKVPSIPTKDDVYNTLIIPSVSGDSCTSCLVGAGDLRVRGAGRERPVGRLQAGAGRRVPRARRGAGALPVYRTYRGGSEGACPS